MHMRQRSTHTRQMHEAVKHSYQAVEHTSMRGSLHFALTVCTVRCQPPRSLGMGAPLETSGRGTLTRYCCFGPQY